MTSSTILCYDHSYLRVSKSNFTSGVWCWYYYFLPWNGLYEKLLTYSLAPPINGTGSAHLLKSIDGMIPLLQGTRGFLKRYRLVKLTVISNIKVRKVKVCCVCGYLYVTLPSTKSQFQLPTGISDLLESK